jgi:hypothetical protein
MARARSIRTLVRTRTINASYPWLLALAHHGRTTMAMPSVSRRPVVARSLSEAGAPLRPDIRVKIGIAEGSGKLDLSDCDLEAVPDEVFELTDLVELSLAGNNLTALPEGIGRLALLEKLQLSGNRLVHLPDSLCDLESLEGLWLHGNLLESLPTDIGSLSNLKQMAIAGNRLAGLPDSIGLLTSLVELVAAGNMLERLPKSIGTLSACRILDLHGNRLTGVPETIALMESLEELWLHGNPTLKSLPFGLGQCASLRKLSAADCGLEGPSAVPPELGRLEELVDLSLYGNRLTNVPVELLRAGRLKKLWLEGNPLETENVEALIRFDRSAGSAGSESGRTALEDDTGVITGIGLDASQLDGCNEQATRSSHPNRPHGPKILRSTTLPCVQGYFKLERHVGAHSSLSEPSPVLIVAFGSAPGTPNWGGVLRRVRDDFDKDSHADVNFDVLYVVDPERSWYHGGDDRFQEYDAAIQSVAASYDNVLYLGDSMGATACLLYAQHANVVHAFCPQIDLGKSSIRPGEDPSWENTLKNRALAGIDNCEGHLHVHVGNWQHDIQQVHPVQAEHASVKIYGVDSHRLAIALERSGKLMRILQSSILGFYGRMSHESITRISKYP